MPHSPRRWTTWRLVWPAAVVLLVVTAAVAWRIAKSRAHVRPLVVVVSGDTAGWIAPCGCTSNQSGGLPRRGTYVEGIRRDRGVILVDAGGAPGGTSIYDRIKFEAILKGERLMGSAAHNLGGPEAAFGAETLREIRKATGAPFV